MVIWGRGGMRGKAWRIICPVLLEEKRDPVFYPLRIPASHVARSQLQVACNCLPASSRISP